ncbi:Asl3112 protein [Umezakia ovalisporum]|nr:Asl3112 protein [Umezakia ovalisporum]
MKILHKGGASIMKTLSISKKNISAMTTADVEQLANRLEVDNYSNAFEGLNDWHLLRAIAFQRPELVEPYIHLLDLEAYDEA